MTDDFDIDRINTAIRKVNAMNKMPCSNTAALSEYERTARDESPEERAPLREKIEALAAKKLQDVAFICEAFSEIESSALKFIGRSAASWDNLHRSDNMEIAAGATILCRLQSYAIACAEREVDGK